MGSGVAVNNEIGHARKRGHELIKELQIINDDGSILDSPSLLANNVDPVVRGFVKDWDAMEDLLHHVMYNGLGWEIGNEGQIFICSSTVNTKEVGPSIALASLSKVLAFAVGSFFSMPGCRGSDDYDQAEEPEEVKIMLRLEMMFS
nr:actin-related protein 7 [Tanacetum cinerariifolium]